MVKESKSTTKPEDWFKKLETAMAKKSEEVLKGYSLESGKKQSINLDLIQSLWKIALKFGDINVHFTLDPQPTQWASFIDYPNLWKVKDEYNFGAINTIAFIDTTREDNRTGDALRIFYQHDQVGEKIKIVFEFFEEAKYYKYSGWKRTYARHTLYEENVAKCSLENIHNIISELILQWYESHLKHDRNMLLSYIREKYPIVETYSE